MGVNEAIGSTQATDISEAFNGLAVDDGGKPSLPEKIVDWLSDNLPIILLIGMCIIAVSLVFIGQDYKAASVELCRELCKCKGLNDGNIGDFKAADGSITPNQCVCFNPWSQGQPMIGYATVTPVV